MVIALLLAGCTLVSDGDVTAKVGVGRDSGLGDSAGDSGRGDSGDSRDDTAALDEDGDGYTVGEGDCDDGDAAVHPNAIEDCSTVADLNCDGSTGRIDNDGDGHDACEECDDTDAAVHPGAQELCNGRDDDCDGATDVNASDELVWYADLDGDRYGDPDSTAEACDQPDGHVSDSGDCDDSAAEIHPGAAEYCDLIDEDCNGAVDDDALDALVWYLDDDGDGFGDSATMEVACSGPARYVENSLDCADDDPAVSPASTEVCDAADADEDCSGSADDRDAGVAVSTMSAFYPDGDGDGYGDEGSTVGACDAPPGYVTDGTDCDDGDDTVNPGAAEVCSDGVDNDCDGGAGACGLSGTVSTADVSWTGEAAGDAFGTALTAGDFDADGQLELASGAPGRDGFTGNDGEVYAFWAPFAGGSASGATQTSVGGASSSETGTALAAGDFDGDGYADTVVGEASDDCDAQDCGTARVLTGAVWPASVAASPGVWEFSRYSSSSTFGGLGVGSAAAALGDLDGDGNEEVAIGAPDNDGGWGGAVFVRSDVPITSYLWGGDIWLAEASSDLAGFSVAGGNDLDGDGLGDLAIGAPGRTGLAGAVYVTYTPGSGYVSLSGSDLRIDGETASYLGSSVAISSDMDGDGRGELLMGAREYSGGTGRAYIAYGGSSLSLAVDADVFIDGSAAGDYLGSAVCGPGDVDVDGGADLLVGAYGTAGGGAAYLFTGALTGTLTTADAAAVLAPAAGTALFGSALLCPGDLDGDGASDLVVGAPADATAGAGAGAIYLFLGGGM